MKLQHIELSKLKLSPVNVRKHGGKNVAELIASIRSLGVIQPLLVRPNCEGFEVVAGQRRLRACQALEQETGKADPVPCAILDTGDDAAAIEASLAENIARLPMDDVDQFEAFSALKAQGLTIADIAAHFGVTERLIKQSLAIANLYDPILNAYRNDEFDAPTLRALTMATKTKQKAWFKLFRDPEQHAPMGRCLKAWLFGGTEIPVSSALFPIEEYDGNIVTDLFGEDQYFDDPDKFHKLQLEAIIHRQAAYLEDGWSDVIIMQTGDYWSSWDKAKRDKSKGGKVYISCAADGEVGFHEGWLPEKEAKRHDKALAKANGEDKAQPTAKPELTKAAMTYLALHRHNAVRMELLKAPQIALRLIVVNIINTGGLWDVRPERQSTNRNEAISKSIDDSKAQKAFAKERQAVRELIGLRPKDGMIVWPDSEPVDGCTLFARLLDLPDKDVLRVLTFIMAETLQADTAEIEALGHMLKVDMDDWWTPDDTFFDLLRDKPMINAMLAEIGGKATAAGNITATAKVQKSVMKNCLAGTGGRNKVKAWKPRYMRFPMQTYTKRKGLPPIDQWRAVKKLFDKR